jgi:two-component system cell cycle response regulator
VRALAADGVDLLLLGARLPDVDGFQLCARIRKERRASPLQVVLLLASHDAGVVRQAAACGADDFLCRPWSCEELAARVDSAVARREAQAELYKEREFYRIAVAEEERLSSLVLDQNRSLKEAYERIRLLNEELQKANGELEQIAAYDSLSGLLNRRTLFQRIEVEIERATRMSVPLAGLMIDIDHFKTVNDNFGHPCGDNVIREIGRRLLARLRKYDYAGRYGGEEFFVLLANSTDLQAVGIGERFRAEMEQMRLACGGEDVRITISVGVSSYRPGESQEAWIERTDRAMYQAKQAGRNSVVRA